MTIAEFLASVITTETGWFNISTLPPASHTWQEMWYRWPEDVGEIENQANLLKETLNVYFSPHIFSEKCSKKDFVLPTRTIVADLDEADIGSLALPPSILVETSPQRHQGYWILREDPGTLDALEELSRRLTYAIPRCDRGGWHLGKRVRLPDTYNHKYSSGMKPVKIVQEDLRKYEIERFDYLPILAARNGQHDEDFEWVKQAELSEIGPQEILALFRTKLPSKIANSYSRPQGDRSAALWALMMACFRAGCTKEQVYILAKHSAHNKFADLRDGGLYELAKDVVRAEIAAGSSGADILKQVLDARKSNGSSYEKKELIAKLVRTDLAKRGQFINCPVGGPWYVRKDLGKPLAVAFGAEQFALMLDTAYGLNPTETEARYTMANMVSHCSELIPNGQLASLSYYLNDSNAILLHTGRKTVLKIDAKTTEQVTDGYSEIVFQWIAGNQPFTPAYNSVGESWYEIMFGDCFDNIIGLKREQAMTLIRVWFLMVLMRNKCVSRPILALFGQPGSGKSTLFRRIYTLLYGAGRSLNAITNPDDFDFAVSIDPVVVLDNVDGKVSWLPDRLALSAANSEFMRRKLYTNSEVVTLRRQAMVGITAHNPQWVREDVADRLVLLNFERIQDFKPEGGIIERIVSSRNVIWGQIVRELQRVLAEPAPPVHEVPQFRIEDFASIGYWIASALGIEATFKGAIEYMRSSQRALALEQDTLLTDAINRWHTIQLKNDPSKIDEFRAPSQLWSVLSSAAQDERQFALEHGNAMRLGRKLWALQDALKSAYDIEWTYDSHKHARVWRIRPHKNGLAK